jgi:integrase
VPRHAAVIEYRGKRGVVYRIKYADADGTQVQETIGAERDGVTRKQAEAELRERLVRVERKHYRRPKALTFAEWTAVWFEEGKHRRGWKPKTVKTHGHRLAHLDDYFDKTCLGSIRPRDVAAYIKHALTERSARSVIGEVNLLHDVMQRAVAEELIQANPVIGVERPKTKPLRWRILEPAEIRRVAAAFTDERARAAFLTLHLTGLRRHELQGLLWRDVSLTEGTLRVVESKSEEGERLLALSPALVDVLSRRYQETPFKTDTDYVFAHPETGMRLGADRYAALLRDALEAAGIEDRERIRPFHDARHAALTHLAMTPEASELLLMAVAGHRSFSTTRQYLHLAGRAFPEAARALEDQLLAGTTLYPSEVTSADLSEPEASNDAASDLG